MHIKFCKSLIGIHRISTNFAVLSELGRFPIHFDILKAMLSYWHRLENLDPDCSSLLKNAFVESKYLFHMKCPSWCSSLQVMVSNIQGVESLPSVRSYKLKDTIKKILSEYYLKCWHSDWNLHSSKKLRCYQGRIQDLWLGGAWVGEGSGDRLRSPVGQGQSPGSGPRGQSPLEALGGWGITDIYLKDNFEPTTPFLSNQKNLT
jgi:hypothetical protein